MSIVVIGLNHRSAPLALLEKSIISAEDLPKNLAGLSQRDHISEAVIVSTCNRTEAYVVAEKFHAAYAEMRDFFAESAFVAPEDISDCLYVHHDDDAVKHLFSVASGLDSAVLGESEIQGQIKTSWETARLEGTSGAVLNLLFRHAVETGKRARNESSIGRHTASVSHAAVLMATEHFGSLIGRTVLVVGAGEMGEGMVVALAAAGPDHVYVANRTTSKADALATRIDGSSIPLEDLAETLGDVDVLMTSTGATEVILDNTSIAEVIARRAGEPLLIVDIAMPRDIDPEVAQIDGVTLLDMDDLSSFAANGRMERANEVETVELIVESEAKRFADVRSAREIAPLIASMRGTVEAKRSQEVDKFARKAGYSDSDRASLDQFTRGLVAKLLHEPTAALKEAAGSAKGDRLADSVRDLFDL